MFSTNFSENLPELFYLSDDYDFHPESVSFTIIYDETCPLQYDETCSLQYDETCPCQA